MLDCFAGKGSKNFEKYALFAPFFVTVLFYIGPHWRKLRSVFVSSRSISIQKAINKIDRSETGSGQITKQG